MKISNHFFTAVILSLGISQASASLIVNLATGLDGSGNVQTAGDSVDANWIYNDPAASPMTGSAKVVAPNYADWYGSWFEVKACCVERQRRH